MAGKSIEESKQAYRDARRAKNGQASSSNATHQPNGKVPIKFRDKNGRAYITYIDSAETFSAEDTAPDAFVGVATDNANSIQPTAPDTVDYHGFMAFEELALRDELKATVDWNIRSRTPDAAALSVTTSQSDIPLSLEDHPFYCDTGASVHISPDKNDFSNLRPLTSPRRVKGVGGSAISAIGIGDIKLHIGKGKNIMLQNVLYIPASTVRLISVQTLARESRLRFTFGDDDDGCWITNKSNAILARGTLTTKSLYTLNLYNTKIEHAYVSHTVNLETWHRRLGHANYQSITDMARKGMITDENTST